MVYAKRQTRVLPWGARVPVCDVTLAPVWEHCEKEEAEGCIVSRGTPLGPKAVHDGLLTEKEALALIAVHTGTN